MIRYIKTKTVCYRNLKEMIHEVRFQIANSKIMDFSKDILEAKIMEMFLKYDDNNDDLILIGTASDCLRECKYLSLTLFQINILLGLTDPNMQGILPFKKFVPLCVDHIQSMFFYKPIFQKSMILASEKEHIDLTHAASAEFDPIELFRTFQRYDRNQNGTLDFGEYFTCLSESGLGLRKNEIISMTLQADVNGDQEIDFSEFVKHFTNCLDMMSFVENLNSRFECVCHSRMESSLDVSKAFDKVNNPVSNNSTPFKPVRDAGSKELLI